MLRFRSIFAYLVLATALGLPRSAFGQATPTYVVQSPPSHISIDDQVYSFSVNGLRSYLDSIQYTQPQIHAVLDPELRRLERQLSTGKIIGFTSLGVGLGVMMIPLLVPPSCDTSDCKKHNQYRALAFLGIGAGIALGGGVVGFAVLPPSREDALQILNHHNQLNPNHPMRLSVGFDPQTHVAGGSLRLSF